MDKQKRIPLLLLIGIAITMGIVMGILANYLDRLSFIGLSLPVVRGFVTFNSIFSNFLQFLIPLIIIGLITPAISDIGKSAGKLLLITTLIAYGDTVFSGYLSYYTSSNVFPFLINHGRGLEKISEIKAIEPFFTINIPPLVDAPS